MSNVKLTPCINFAKLCIHSYFVKKSTIQLTEAGVPKADIRGHAYHNYKLLFPDDTVQLGFLHNVNGRDTYVDGTLKAIDFLATQINEGVRGKCFSMKDVMKG